MSHVLVSLVVCLLGATTALAGFSQSQNFRPATPEEVALKDVSFAPGASAVILDWVEIDEDPHSISSEYYRVKVLTEEGRKYGDVEVPYLAGYPFSGRVTEISARTIQPDGRIIPFDGKVYDKVILKAGGVRLRAKTFSLPDVQPGSILEYRFQRRWAEMLLVNTTWVIQRDIPVQRARMSLTPFDTRGEYRSYFTYFNLPEGKKPVLTGKSYGLEVTNVPPYQAEAFSPPEDWLKMRVNFYYTDNKTDLSQFWAVQLANWTRTIEGYIGRPAPVQSVALALIGKTPLETARNIYAKVQTFRNLSFEDESAADTKKNAAAVVERAEGYRSEINRAFVALARAAGLEASVVKVVLIGSSVTNHGLHQRVRSERDRSGLVCCG